MRRLWGGLGFTLAVLILSGCATQDHLKPPKPPESFNGPPDEARFQKPPEIPQKYLMEESAAKDFDLTSPDATMKKGNSFGNPIRTGGAGGGGY